MRNYQRKTADAPRRKLATLTPLENHAWEHAFAFHLDAGHADKMADSLAWRDVQKEFPRLKQFDGAKP